MNYKIQDICKKICSGGTPNKKNKEYYNGGIIPWLNTGEINFNRIYKTTNFISEAGLNNSSAKCIPENSVIIAMYGATAGKVAISKISLSTNQACCNLMVDESIADYRYLYYYLSSKYKHLSSLANGAAQQNISTGQIKEYLIDLPSLYIQKSIASTLSSIDDKIELNNKINDNLLQQATTLFSELIDGKDKNGCLGDYCSVKSGFAFKSAWWQNSGVKVIKIGSITQDSLDLKSCSYVSSDKIALAKDFIVTGGDLIIAMTGATIGKFTMVPKTEDVILVNQRVGKFFLGNKPIERLPFIYCLLKQEDIYNDIIGRGQGSAQPNISGSDIMSVSCVIPSNNEIDLFNFKTNGMFKMIIANQQENNQLSELRDSLLPKLMSGEIDVSQVKS